MESDVALISLAALAQNTRLDVFRLLVRHEPEGLPAGEIARTLAVPANTLSAHLNVLSHAGLVRGERHSRSIVYRADISRLSALASFLVEDCCGGRPELCAPLHLDCLPAVPKRPPPMTDRVYNVLFLCTGNTARSILAESILRHEGGGKFNAFSAGSQPKGLVNPLAVKVLHSFSYPVDGLRSKSWDEFAGSEAPKMDFVFTVCDNAAGEACPVWPGQPMTAHWGIEDPAAVEGTELEKERAFVTAFRYLKNRISAFAALPIKSLDRLTLQKDVSAIGRLEGATMEKARSDPS